MRRLFIVGEVPVSEIPRIVGDVVAGGVVEEKDLFAVARLVRPEREIRMGIVGNMDDIVVFEGIIATRGTFHEQGDIVIPRNRQ